MLTNSSRLNSKTTDRHHSLLDEPIYQLLSLPVYNRPNPLLAKTELIGQALHGHCYRELTPQLSKPSADQRIAQRDLQRIYDALVAQCLDNLSQIVHNPSVGEIRILVELLWNVLLRSTLPLT